MHRVKLCLSISSQPISVWKAVASKLSNLNAGTVDQPMLQKKGNDIRIDWDNIKSYVALLPKQKAKCLRQLVRN